MLAIAKAYKERSLQDFQAALSAHEAQLMGDPIVRAHLSALYDTLLEGNLARLIEPFSRVEIAHLAELIKLPIDLVLNKLSQARLCSLSLLFSLPITQCLMPAGFTPAHERNNLRPCLFKNTSTCCSMHAMPAVGFSG